MKTKQAASNYVQYQSPHTSFDSDTSKYRTTSQHIP